MVVCELKTYLVWFIPSLPRVSICFMSCPLLSLSFDEHVLWQMARTFKNAIEQFATQTNPPFLVGILDLNNNDTTHAKGGDYVIVDRYACQE